MKTLSIYKKVWVKLTEYGLEKLKKNHEELSKKFPTLGEYTPPILDENGRCEMILLELINTFGDDWSIGSKFSPIGDYIEIDESQFEPTNK